MTLVFLFIGTSTCIDQGADEEANDHPTLYWKNFQIATEDVFQQGSSRRSMELRQALNALSYSRQGSKSGEFLLTESDSNDIDSQFILRNISGSAKAGEVLAIIGSSGSGKTTLLKTLLGILPKQSGQIFYGSREIKDPLISYAGFVEQDRPFLSGMTVMETMIFEAQLRVNGTHEERIAMIEQILFDFNLYKAR